LKVWLDCYAADGFAEVMPNWTVEGRNNQPSSRLALYRNYKNLGEDKENSHSNTIIFLTKKPQ
jgi:hypothetical protein